MKIIVFGDSTTAIYKDAFYPQQGWAYFLPEYIKEDVEVKNFAWGGASLKNFLYSKDYVNGITKMNEPEKSYWSSVILPEVAEGDIVIMYWAGINDMLQSSYDCYRPHYGGEYVRDWQNTSRESYIWIGEGLGTHTYFTVRSEIDEMKLLLREMIGQIQERKAIPIIVKGTGKYYKVHDQDKNVVAVNRKYAEAVIDVARACDVEHYDMGIYMDQEFAQKGYDVTLQKYLLPVSVVQEARVERGIEKPLTMVDDNVHYNWHGAQLLCRQLIEQIKRENSVLSKWLY